MPNSRTPLDFVFVLTKQRLQHLKNTKKKHGKIVPIACRVCDKELLEGDMVCMVSRRRYVHASCAHLARQDIPEGNESDEEVLAFFNIVT